MVRSRRARDVGLGVLVLLLACAAHAPALHGSFLDYDDDSYVTENPHVREGLGAEGLRWALTATHAANWHPLTWLSHQLDVELWGLDPHGHHLSSLLLHAVNSVLLFAWLRSLTRSPVLGAWVAALFTVHPLRVESVAWIAERKDVLSALFALLSLWAYTSWTRKGGWVRYAGAWLALAAGLAAKPMLVTLPFAFLLLDFWPLARWRAATLRTLLLEKLPFFALASVSSIVTFVVQRHAGAVNTATAIAPAARLANAAVSYLRYLGKTLWPADLALLYPHPALPGGRALSSVAIAASIVALLAITLVAVRARSQPWLLVGWLWFTGMLVPTIGLVQVGVQAMADRYTYLPSIGLALAVVWTVADLARRYGFERSAALAGMAVIAALVLASRAQAGHWRDSLALYEHAIEVTGGSPVLHTNLGAALERAGRKGQAETHYLRAIEIDSGASGAHHNFARLALERGEIALSLQHARAAVAIEPSWPDAYIALGNALAARGARDEAVAAFQRAAGLDPRNPSIRFNLGNALAARGLNDEAREAYREALRLDPRFAAAHINLANLLLSTGQLASAEIHFHEALRADASLPEAWYGLGTTFARRGEGARAVQSFREASARKPAWSAPWLASAWVLATDLDPAVRDGGEAVRQAERALALGERDARGLDTLAAALAENGRFAEAATTAAEAVRLAERSGHAELSARIEQRLRGYRDGRAYRSGLLPSPAP